MCYRRTLRVIQRSRLVFGRSRHSQRRTRRRVKTSTIFALRGSQRHYVTSEADHRQHADRRYLHARGSPSAVQNLDPYRFGVPSKLRFTSGHVAALSRIASNRRSRPSSGPHWLRAGAAVCRCCGTGFDRKERTGFNMEAVRHVPFPPERNRRVPSSVHDGFWPASRRTR